MSDRFFLRQSHKDDIASVGHFIRRAQQLIIGTPFLDILDQTPLPTMKDYSSFLTLVRDQDGCGGCFLMTAMAIQDIFKEMECPYTPDASFHFAEYVYNISKLNGDPSDLNRPSDSRFPEIDENYDDAHQRSRFGCCSEASFSSNYDAPHNLDKPSPQNVAEALNYKLNFSNDQVLGGKDLSVNRVKALLNRIGPIGVANHYHEHVVAIIGYNDNQIASDGKQGAFLIQNSWGDGWGDNGREWVSYDSFAQPHDQVCQKYVFWFTNVPTPRPLIHRFTGRVNIRTNAGRRFISVAVGVEGQPMSLVWNRPCQSFMTDSSTNLSFDFPLPNYAANHWPPNDRNRWYVEVSDTSSTSLQSSAGVVEDVILVERLFTNQGNCMPVLHRPSGRGFKFNGQQVVRIYIPTRKRAHLILRANKSRVRNGEEVKLTGSLSLMLHPTNALSATVPLAGHTVHLSQMTSHDSIEGSIYDIICTVQTDNHGHFSHTLLPSHSTRYQADAVKLDSTILAKSNLCDVDVY